MQLNISKTKVTAADFLHEKSIPTESGVHRVCYQGMPLPNLPAEQSFKYLGVRISLLRGTRDEVTHVLQKTSAVANALVGHIVQPRPLANVVRNLCQAIFRYSAPCTEWSERKLGELYGIWCRAQKYAWKLMRSHPLIPFQHPAALPEVRPEVIQLLATVGHVESQLKFDDSLRKGVRRDWVQTLASVHARSMSDAALVKQFESGQDSTVTDRLARLSARVGVELHPPELLTPLTAIEGFSWPDVFRKNRTNLDAETTLERWLVQAAPLIREQIVPRRLTWERDSVGTKTWRVPRVHFEHQELAQMLLKDFEIPDTRGTISTFFQPVGQADVPRQEVNTVPALISKWVRPPDRQTRTFLSRLKQEIVSQLPKATLKLRTQE